MSFHTAGIYALNRKALLSHSFLEHVQPWPARLFAFVPFCTLHQPCQSTSPMTGDLSSEAVQLQHSIQYEYTRPGHALGIRTAHHTPSFLPSNSTFTTAKVCYYRRQPKEDQRHSQWLSTSLPPLKSRREGAFFLREDALDIRAQGFLGDRHRCAIF